MCESMVDIQPPTAEIRRGKRRKKERKEEEITAGKYNGLPITTHGRPGAKVRQRNTRCQFISICHRWRKTQDALWLLFFALYKYIYLLTLPASVLFSKS